MMNKFIGPVILAMLICSCAMQKQVLPAPMHKEAPELKSVLFKRSLPIQHERVAEALENAQWGVDALRWNASIILSAPRSVRFQVIGATDNEECAAEACLELSLRRASLVIHYLESLGVPAWRFLPPVGVATKYIGDMPASEDERYVVRRVDFSAQ